MIVCGEYTKRTEEEGELICLIRDLEADIASTEDHLAYLEEERYELEKALDEVRQYNSYEENKENDARV